MQRLNILISKFDVMINSLFIRAIQVIMKEEVWILF